MAHNAALRTACSALALALAGFGALAVLLAMPACQDRKCDGIGSDWGRVPGQGSLIDQNTWESSPTEGKWIPFTPQRTWYIYPSGFERRKIANVVVYVSAQEEPNVQEPGDTFGIRNQYTVASGNLALITHFDDPADPRNPAVRVKNDTCGDFFVRIVLEAYPVAPFADAGVDGAGAEDAPASDAESPDATPDAQPDAPTDGAAE